LRCRKIVTSLLDFARQSAPARKPCDINNVVNESVVLTNKQAAFKDVALIYKPGADIPLVQLDKGQIQQSLINLIINAVEATDAGGTISISTVYKPQPETIEVAVSDTGAGISETDLVRIFDPFYTTKDNGNGLGLAITHGIIEQHNGTIEVHSRLGRGTTFTIKLPITSGADHAA
jgi:two-component system NtrC family sensor kinase